MPDRPSTETVEESSPSATRSGHGRHEGPGAWAVAITRTGAAIVIALLGIIGGMGLVMGLGSGTATATTADGQPRGSDSAKALELKATMPESSGSTAVIVFSRDDGKLTEADRSAITAALSRAKVPPGPPLQNSEDGTAAVAIAPITTNESDEVTAAVGDLRSALRDGLPSGLKAEVTGAAGIKADLAGVFEGADLRLLITTGAIVALLLIVTYRSPILWLLPLTVVGVADRVAAGGAAALLDGLGMPWDGSTTGILSVLVFGAGTDYALLLISRYRDELRRHEDRREAMAIAATRTREAVMSSAATVFVGLLTLLLSAFPTTRALGLVCALGVLVAAFFVLVVLPAVMVIFGRWIFWPLVPRVDPSRADSIGQAASGTKAPFWRRVGDRVARAPRAFIGGTLALLAVMSIGLGFVNIGLSSADRFIDKPEAIAASERLAQSFPAGSAEPVIILTKATPDAVTSAAQGVSGVSGVRAVAASGGVTELNATVSAEPGSAQAETSVRELRAALADLPETHVAGSTAEAMDRREGAVGDQKLIFPIVLLLVLGALILLFRSILAPVILVATVLATYAASLGASWWIFTQVFDFGALDDLTPLYSFVFLVALGVDYNIFLVSRAREESRAHGTREGMLRGLAATGGVITSAGILLAAVFAVLGVLPLVALAQIGVVICIGVLLDTLVVRTLLVPALALQLGDRFWWPRTVSGATTAP